MLLVTAEEMRALDQQAIEGLGIPGLILMENAGRGVAEAILQHYPTEARAGISILIGPGNNGGDGFVVARHLFQQGFWVELMLLTSGEKFKGDALVNYRISRALKLPLTEILDEDQVHMAEPLLRQCGLIVDALFGTGLKREVTGRFARVIQMANDSGRPIVAVDIPSGLCADTGRPLGACIRADLTVTMALAKTGHVTMPGADYTGRLEVVDIGIPDFLVQEADILAEFMDLPALKTILGPRPQNGHKGTFGHLLVLSGSRGKTGACALVALGAIRAGSGLVTVGCPRGSQGILACKLTEAMTQPLPETGEGTLSMDALAGIERLLEKKRAVALGPGVGLEAETQELMRHLIRTLPLPMVVDADGLTAIGTDHQLIGSSGYPRILTPHPGEMARLTGKSTREIQTDRVGTARELARSTGAIVVLKGARTVTAIPDGRVSVNSTGNPGMGAGGMGDVLTGIMGGLLALGLDPWDAARAAVYAHGMAADQLARVKGPWGYTAQEVADWLPRVWALCTGQEASAP